MFSICDFLTEECEGDGELGVLVAVVGVRCPLCVGEMAGVCPLLEGVMDVLCPRLVCDSIEVGVVCPGQYGELGTGEVGGVVIGVENLDIFSKSSLSVPRS
jgi:hypothetical protein